MLGKYQSQVFIGLIADLRAAFFASEVPSSPFSIIIQDSLYMLNWVVSPKCILATSVGRNGNGANNEWQDAYRIRLEHIVLDGKVII